MRLDNPSNLGFYAKISDNDEYTVVHLFGDISDLFSEEREISQDRLLREELKKGHLSFIVFNIIGLFELYEYRRLFGEKNVQLIDLGNVEYQKLIEYMDKYATAYNDGVDLGIIAKKTQVRKTYDDKLKGLEDKLKEIGASNFKVVFYGRIADAEGEIYNIEAYSFEKGLLKIMEAKGIKHEQLEGIKKNADSKGVDAVYVGVDTTEQLPVKISEAVARYVENISLNNRKTSLGDDLARD